MSKLLTTVDDVAEHPKMAEAIAQLHQAQATISDLQAITVHASIAWHRCETIDDYIHGALECAGD